MELIPLYPWNIGVIFGLKLMAVYTNVNIRCFGETTYNKIEVGSCFHKMSKLLMNIP